MQNLSASSKPEMGQKGSVPPEPSLENDPRNCEENYVETSALLKSQETESKYIQWTDEKHRMYLKSMEASIANELYNSLDTFGGCSQQECPSEPKLSRQNLIDFSITGQFKVFKDGYWTRVNFSSFIMREMPRPKKADKSSPILANPWIKRYRSSYRHQNGISPALQEQAMVSTIVDQSALQFCCRDSISSDAEVTDQNLVDEVSDEKKPRTKWSQKCRKTSADSSCNDQNDTAKVHVHGSPMSRNSE